MARDVEYDVIANDKSDPGLASFARKMEAADKKMKADAEKAFGGIGRSLIATANLAGPKMGQAVTKGIASAASAAGPVLASVAAYAAPLIAGTLSGAIIGGAGIGGVIGGVILAARDPRVAAAGSALGEHMLGELEVSAQTQFVGPVLKAIATVESRFDSLGGVIGRIFANSARYVEPLTEGVLNFAESALRGFDTLVAKAGPVIAAIRDGFTELGGDVQQFFETIAGGSDAAAVSIRQLFDLIGGLLDILGPVIRALTEVNAALERIGIKPGILQMIGALDDTDDAARRTGSGFFGLDGAMQQTSATATAQRASMEELASAHYALVSAATSLYQSETSVAGALASATKAIRDNGRGLDRNSEKGRANRTVLGSLAQTLNGNYQAYVKVNGAGYKADEVMRRNHASFVRVATAATGSASKARQLADALLGVPSVKPKIDLVDHATGKLNTVLNRMAAVRSKTVTVTVLTRQSGDAAALRKQSLPAFSAAGTFAAAAGGGSYRTGGPAPVQVASRVQVDLDGRPFYDYTTRAVRAADDRRAFRDRVGRKVT